MSQSFLLFVLLLSVSTSLQKSIAQEVGVDLCACTPRSYEFTLDFSLTCDQSNIVAGPGIIATFCLIDPDLILDEVSIIEIKERDQSSSTLPGTEVEGPLYDGDTFTYTSATIDPSLPGSSLPQSLQLFIGGTSASKQNIEIVLNVAFTNDCSIFPVFDNGGTTPQIGVIKLTELTAAAAEYCPLSPTSRSPTLAPTTEPPTSNPTQAPTYDPTMSPTRVPTVSPTSTPTLAPTLAPTGSPTLAPTGPPTMLRTKEPTLPPTSIPTNTPSSVQTLTPTPIPTFGPTQTPTGTPTLNEDEESEQFSKLLKLIYRLLSLLFGAK